MDYLSIPMVSHLELDGFIPLGLEHSWWNCLRGIISKDTVHCSCFIGSPRFIRHSL